MNRTEVLVGSAIAVLAVVGFGQIYHDRGALRDVPQSKPDPSLAAQAAAAAGAVTAQDPERPVTVDEVVSNFMTSLTQGSEDQKLDALGNLLDQLESKDYVDAKLSSETTQPLVDAAVAAVTVSTDAETPEVEGLRARLAYFVAARTRGESSTKFVLDQLENGAPEVKAALARGLGKAGGVHGRAIFESMVKQSQAGAIPGTLAPEALRRLGGKDAVEPIVALMKSTDDWKTIGACVVALQDGRDPAVLGPALERLEQVGLLENPGKLPWISPKLLGAFLQTADASGLQRGLSAANSRPALLKSALDAAKRGLASSDAETRRLSAQAVRQAVLDKLLSTQDGESLLAEHPAQDAGPVLKAELKAPQPEQ